MSDTPRTDEAEINCITDIQMVEHARQLELELNELKRMIFCSDLPAFERMTQERDKWMQCAEDFLIAWEGYKIFPSFANEELFTKAISRFNKLKGQTK